MDNSNNTHQNSVANHRGRGRGGASSSRGRGGADNNKFNDDVFLEVEYPNNRTVTWKLLSNISKKYKVGFSEFDPHNPSLTASVIFSGKTMDLLEAARNVLLDYIRVKDEWFNAEDEKRSANYVAAVPTFESSIDPKTHIGSATMKSDRTFYTNFKRLKGLNALEEHELRMRDEIREAVNQAFFPRDGDQIHPIPLSKRLEAPSGAITIEGVPNVSPAKHRGDDDDDGNDQSRVVFAVDSTDTHRKDDCLQAYWETQTASGENGAAPSATTTRLCLAVHVCNASLAFPIGSVQDRSFSAAASPFYFNTPNIAKIVPPCGPYRDQRGKAVGIPDTAVLTSDDSEEIKKECDALRDDMYFTEKFIRPALSAIMYYDIVEQKGEDGSVVFALRRDYDASRFVHSNVTLGQSFNSGDKRFELAVNIVTKACRKQALASHGGSMVKAAINTARLHQALIDLEEEKALAALSTHERDSTFGNNVWRSAVIAHFLSTLLVEFAYVPLSATSNNNNTSKVDNPFPLGSTTRDLAPPRYLCDDVLSPGERSFKYTFAPLTLKYSASLTIAHMKIGPLDEYTNFALYTLLSCDSLRPYIVEDGWHEYSFVSERKSLKAMSDPYDTSVPRVALPPITHPGRNYASLYTQRLLSLAVKEKERQQPVKVDAAFDTAAVACEKEKEVADPHFSILSRVFDIQNPADEEWADVLDTVKPLLRNGDEDLEEEEEEEIGAAKINVVLDQPATAGTPLQNSPSLRVVRAILSRQSRLKRVQREINQLGRRIDHEFLLAHAPKNFKIPTKATVRCINHQPSWNNADETSTTSSEGKKGVVCACLASSGPAHPEDPSSSTTSVPTKTSNSAATSTPVKADPDTAPSGSKIITLGSHLLLRTRMWASMEDILPVGSTPIPLGSGPIDLVMPFPLRGGDDANPTLWTPCDDCVKLAGGVKKDAQGGSYTYNIMSDCVECAAKVPSCRMRMEILLSFDAESNTFHGEWYYPNAISDIRLAKRKAVLAAAVTPAATGQED